MSARLPLRVASEAIAAKGWLASHKWLLARRATQLGILLAFLLGPLAGLWIVKGNLSYSYTLGVLPLTDAFVFAQSLAARHWPETLALTGAAIVIAFYALLGGRLYCSWVCPVNVVTDAATWARRRLGIRRNLTLSRHLRYWLLAASLAAAAVTGTLVWETLNPVSMTHRALIFGAGLAWLVVLAVFLFDTLVTPRGWCGHVCPMGAFYTLLGAKGLVRVRAPRSAHCNDCMDCFAVCPEPQVITPVLKGEARGARPTILDAACTACGRCIDVCSQRVFEYGTRLTDRRLRRDPTTTSATGAPPATATRAPRSASANR